MDWHGPAGRLADKVADPDSRWLAMVASVPRHQLVPRWWERDGEGDGSNWVLREGSSDPEGWMRAAYSDRSLVTKVGALHADHAQIGDRAHGRPTSSATMPSLVVRMLRHGRLGDGLSVLDLGTGSGGLTAYAARRIGDQHVTSLDVDSHLTGAARERLAGLGIHPHFVTADATDHVPGSYDRIVSTVGLPAGTGLRPVLAALAPGGRIATTLRRTCLIVTGWKHANGEVVGRVEGDMAGFMVTRSGDDYPPEHVELFADAWSTEGEQVSTGRYPVVDVANAWELRSMLELTVPGVEVVYEELDDQTRVACLVHPDGSWARASAEWTDPPEVHQSGPQKLWTALERIRNRLNVEGSLPLLGAQVRVSKDGVCHFSRGGWSASLGSAG
ncbi:methyltransferase domain-containing protein [Streptomyces sp. ITFR-6]|uniref:methyltransferase domain-containing protein n=1 Tax=Streptomyces sp. ITFR-6 TaxID=3075197 RepID=UPI00288963AC|nr:methyltransferase domain-containing protein [Streptomyces sp. ITFR-6]WNI29609.1 methyltransferase domain-containing protein [Streptomyces sp. ITFR-6]